MIRISPKTARRIQRVSRSTRAFKSTGTRDSASQRRRQDSSSVSACIGVPQQRAQHGSRAGQARSDIGFGDAEHVGDFGIAHTLERQRDHLRVGEGKTLNGGRQTLPFLFGRQCGPVGRGIRDLQRVAGLNGWQPAPRPDAIARLWAMRNRNVRSEASPRNVATLPQIATTISWSKSSRSWESRT